MAEKIFSDRIRPLGLSPEGEKWVSRALYPPGLETKLAIPDRQIASSLRSDGRPALVVEPPPGLAAGAEWDLMVISLPGDNNAVYTVASPSGASFEADVPPINIDVNRVRRVSMFPPTGVRNVTLQDFTMGDPGATDVAATLLTPPSVHRSFRHTYRGFTVHMTASDLNNGGTVTAAQFPMSPQPTNGLWRVDRPAPGAATRFYGTVQGTLHLSETAITRGVPDAHVGPAKEGVFIPIRIAPEGFTNTHTYRGKVHHHILGYAASVFDTSSVPAPMIVCDTNAGGPPWWAVWNFFNNPSNELSDYAFSNSNVGVAIFRGISDQASFTVQAYFGNEYILDESSPFLSLTQMPPMHDPRALVAYDEISHSTARAYPARMNSFGTALVAAANVAKRILPFIGTAARFIGNVIPPASAPPAHHPAPQRAPPARAAAEHPVAIRTPRPKRKKKTNSKHGDPSRRVRLK